MNKQIEIMKTRYPDFYDRVERGQLWKIGSYKNPHRIIQIDYDEDKVYIFFLESDLWVEAKNII